MRMQAVAEVGGQMPPVPLVQAAFQVSPASLVPFSAFAGASAAVAAAAVALLASRPLHLLPASLRQYPLHLLLQLLQSQRSAAAESEALERVGLAARAVAGGPSTNPLLWEALRSVLLELTLLLSDRFASAAGPLLQQQSLDRVIAEGDKVPSASVLLLLFSQAFLVANVTAELWRTFLERIRERTPAANATRRQEDQDALIDTVKAFSPKHLGGTEAEWSYLSAKTDALLLLLLQFSHFHAPAAAPAEATDAPTPIWWRRVGDCRRLSCLFCLSSLSGKGEELSERQQQIKQQRGLSVNLSTRQLSSLAAVSSCCSSKKDALLLHGLAVEASRLLSFLFHGKLPPQSKGRPSDWAGPLLEQPAAPQPGAGGSAGKASASPTAPTASSLYAVALCDAADALLVSCVQAFGADSILGGEVKSAETVEGATGEALRFVCSQVSLQLYLQHAGDIESLVEAEGDPMPLVLPLYRLHALRVRVLLQSGGRLWRLAALFPWKYCCNKADWPQILEALDAALYMWRTGKAEVLLQQAQQPSLPGDHVLPLQSGADVMRDVVEALQYLSAKRQLGLWASTPRYLLTRLCLAGGEFGAACKQIKHLFSRGSIRLAPPDSWLSNYYQAFKARRRGFDARRLKAFSALTEATPEVLDMNEMRQAISIMFPQNEVPPAELQCTYTPDTAALDKRLLVFLRDIVASTRSCLLDLSEGTEGEFLGGGPYQQLEGLFVQLEAVFVAACKKLLYCNPPPSHQAVNMRLSLGASVANSAELHAVKGWGGSTLKAISLMGSKYV
ncbi:hypothetical protein cyc_03261 [Cyclospora cayetanensis]|uniref:Uncharacterized protein n=1 Tax=Cyclospora cayetanensis TaxID=88456 RepID=A0A1D3D3K3_9EIME|nr:hypothetical protein cyc_03261 [Cyclospora cayetanensis]